MKQGSSPCCIDWISQPPNAGEVSRQTVSPAVFHAPITLFSLLPQVSASPSVNTDSHPPGLLLDRSQEVCIIARRFALTALKSVNVRRTSPASRRKGAYQHRIAEVVHISQSRNSDSPHILTPELIKEHVLVPGIGVACIIPETHKRIISKIL